MENKFFAYTLKEYLAQFKELAFYFYDKANNLFTLICEGDGSNLDADDEEDGYVDYWYSVTYDPEQGEVDGGQLLVKELIQDNLDVTVKEVIGLFEEEADILGCTGLLKDKFVNPEHGEEMYTLLCGVEQLRHERVRQLREIELKLEDEEWLRG